MLRCFVLLTVLLSAKAVAFAETKQPRQFPELSLVRAAADDLLAGADDPDLYSSLGLRINSFTHELAEVEKDKQSKTFYQYTLATLAFQRWRSAALTHIDCLNRMQIAELNADRGCSESREDQRMALFYLKLKLALLDEKTTGDRVYKPGPKKGAPAATEPISTPKSATAEDKATAQ
jgi:hypothetical protein